jgi:hypothetical protein
VAFSQTARPTPNDDETVYEVFRNPDNFNLKIINVLLDVKKSQDIETAKIPY